MPHFSAQLHAVVVDRSSEADLRACFRFYGEGKLFLGKSFGALTGSEPPVFLRYLDSWFTASILRGTSPLAFTLLNSFPIKSLHEFLAAADGVFEACIETISSADVQIIQFRLPHKSTKLGQSFISTCHV
jgi:hypothetical protein